MTGEHDNAQKLRSLTRRAVVHAIDDSGSTQTVTAEAHAGYPRSCVPVHQQFGLASHAPVDGAVTHVVAVGGDEADLVAFPPANPSVAHMGGLAEGETILYDAVGQAVYLESGKLVRVQAHTEMMVEIGGKTVLDLTATLATLNVDLKVNGRIDATGDVVGNGTHRYAARRSAETPSAGMKACCGTGSCMSKPAGLAAVYTTLKLPDLRGRFLRGWDNDAGIDPGRALLSAQSAAVGSHTHPLGRLWGWSDESKSDSAHPHSGIAQAIYNTTPSTDGDGVLEDVAGGALGIAIGYGQNGSFTSKTAVLANSNNADNRPANVAFNYIVRAS